MAGNAVMLKHASQTLLVGERFAEAMKAAGLPDGLFQNLVLNHADTEKLIGSGEIDHINFTGSVEGGRRIEKAAAGTFATLGLELGGKDPAYVRADAKLDNAVENLVDGSFFNSGQSCCGVERIYVQGDVYDKFVEGFVENAKGWTLGNPLDRRYRGRADGAPQGSPTSCASRRSRRCARAPRRISTASTISTRKARPISRPKC